MAKHKKAKKKPGRAATASAARAEEHVLDRLHTVLLGRRGGDPEKSYTARLFKRGRAQIAKKLGEEAVETLIEGVRGDKTKLAAESADLLYHLLALWAAADLKPKVVWRELARREGLSGLAEKAARKRP
ncbi:MAG: phosphoribosyl-ATP diphosphatase [Alphaproteobacteria bacterium]|nr:phosphoribosyl-ATP diphosphatase [Alphaproteobacteria bacterium]